MHTELQSQLLFNVLLEGLKNAFNQELSNQSRIIQGLEKSNELPCDTFLETVKDVLKKSTINCDEEFFKQIYLNAFRAGPIVIARNHLALSGKISQEESGVLNPTEINLWIDLDNLSAKVNTKLQTNNMVHKLENRVTSNDYGAGPLSEYKSYLHTSTINSIKNPSERRAHYFILSLFTGMSSVYALTIAALAITNILSLGTVSIAAAVVIGIVAAPVSYYFFQNKEGGYTKPSESPLAEESISTLEELFQKAFSIEQQGTSHANDSSANHLEF